MITIIMIEDNGQIVDTGAWVNAPRNAHRGTIRRWINGHGVKSVNRVYHDVVMGQSAMIYIVSR